MEIGYQPMRMMGGYGVFSQHLEVGLAEMQSVDGCLGLQVYGKGEADMGLIPTNGNNGGTEVDNGRRGRNK